jgi:hypothetical protein
MRFTIVVAIDYDPITIPKDMKRKLELAVEKAIHEGMLDHGQSYVEQYRADVIDGPLDTLTALHPDLPGKSF